MTPRIPVTKEDYARTLAKIIDLHHRTLNNSRLHNPENLEFWECSCLTCKRATEILAKDGYNIERLTASTRVVNSDNAL